MVIIFMVVLSIWAFTNCTRGKMVETIEAPVSAPAVSTPAPSPASEFGALSWEKFHPERKAWSDVVFSLIEADLFSAFDGAKDAERICPKYKALTKGQRIYIWSELVSAISYFESGWNPTSRMVETTMGADPVTGKQVASEGLLQLSYQDVPNYDALLRYPACKIDWKKDKALVVTDPKKTIFDPEINLECGLRILANQIQKKGNVILLSGVYWAVLKDGGKYSKVDSIIGMVQKINLCR